MSWNINNDLVKADNLLMYLVSGDTVDSATSKVIAYTTSCSVNIDSETIDTSSKFSCKWQSTLGGRASYTISADSLYCQKASGDANSAITFDTLLDLMVAGESIKWVIGQEAAFSGECKDNPHVLDTSKPYYKGNAAITSLTLEAGNNEIASSSISLTGDGEIKKVTV